MKKILVSVFLLILLPSITLAAGCTDIAKVDFANRTIVVGGNGQAAEQVFHFRHGVALESEGVDKRPDWRTTLTRDVMVKPEDSKGIRFLTLFRDHLSGSGSWTYLVGLACSGGRVRQVFQAGGVYMRVLDISPERVQVSKPVWKSVDPVCCPSESKRLRYAWDARKRHYLLVGPK